MALEKQFGWLSSPSSEEESREKELRPLTDGEVVTYGSHSNSSHSGRCRTVDVEGEEFVLISGSSEGEDSRPYSCELIDGGRSEGLPEFPPSAHQGILKTAHSSESPSPCPPRKGHTIEWRSRADMPVRMKGLQAATHRGHVYVGGGYTGHAETERTVYDYDPNFDLWAELPMAPMRWFGIAEFKGQLVLVGGKDIEGWRMKMTNRIAAYDDDESKWIHPFPPMSAARSQPIVFSHAHLLVVAGGRKGILDFHVEVFNGEQWTQTTPLPAPCSPLSSHIHNGRWYLLGGISYTTIHHVALDDYLASLLDRGGGVGEAGGGVGGAAALPSAAVLSQDHSLGCPSWKKLAPPPFFVTRITSVGRHVTVFPSASRGARGSGGSVGCHVNVFPLAPGGAGGTGGSSIQVHQYLGEQEGWIHVGKVPNVCVSASPIRLHRGELLLFGGDVDGLHYSNKVYRVTVGSTGTQRKRTKFAS